MGKNLIFLGIGLIIASLLTWNTSSSMSEADIIQKARELGMEFTDEVESQLYQRLEAEIREKLTDGQTSEDSTGVNTVVIEIPPGASGRQVVSILNERGFDGEEFLRRIDALGLTANIKFGEYTVSTDTSIDEIITLLTN